MGAEHSRGPHGYRRITKNRLGDLEGSAPGGLDIDHSNEGARRRPLREPHLRKRAEKELPPLSVGAVGRFVVGSRVRRERRHGAPLVWRRRAHGQRIPDAGQGWHQPCGSREPSKAPSRHAVGFGEAVDRDDTVGGAGQCGHADVPAAVVHVALEELVGDHENIAPVGDVQQGLQRLPPVHRAGRVAGVGKDERLRPGCHAALDVVGVGLPESAAAGGDQDGYAARGRDRPHVSRIVRVGRQHLVARFQQRLKHGRCRLGAAVGHEDLLRLYGDAVFLGQLAREGFPQLRQAVEDIVGLTRAQGIHRRLHDHGRSREVGVAGVETDDVAPAGCQRSEPVALRIGGFPVEEVLDVIGDEPVAQVQRRRRRSTTRTRLSA